MSLKSEIRISSLFIIAAFTILSCGLICIDELEISTYPDTCNCILKKEDRITVNFQTAPEKSSLEKLFRIEGPDGQIDGDFNWNENEAEYIPCKALSPGYRYCLKIDGEIRTREGKLYRKNISIPFYYETDESPPVVEFFEPSNAGIVDINTPLRMVFSRQIKTAAFDSAFSLNPGISYRTEWNKDSTEVNIIPDPCWMNLKYYRWTLSDCLTDMNGISLPCDAEGSFLVQQDITPPELTGVFPAVEDSSGTFTLLSGIDLDSLGINQHIAMRFSEDVDYFSLTKCLLFEPSIRGYLLNFSSDILIYYISENLSPGCEYSLELKEGISDTSGNISSDEWNIRFTPDVPEQLITSVELEDRNGLFAEFTADDFNPEGFFDTTALEYFDTGRLHFIIRLSEGYPPRFLNQRGEFESSISLQPLFPPGTAVPAVLSCHWENENSLRVIYEGLDSCVSDEPVYYTFKIRKGSIESATPIGSYLTESVFINFIGEIE